jgi:alpha-L-fucosidase
MPGYMNATTLITSLLDIISKNGNFLLDIGPMANGTIVQTEADTLREAGAWIQDHAEAVYNTSYWFVSPGGGEVRYTTTGDAFYILVLSKPNSTLVLEDPVPWAQGDEVAVVGGGMNGTVVESELGDDGELVVSVPEEVAEADSLAWVFKIAY